jgi:antitoxin PrlF
MNYTTSITSKYQITLPKSVRDKLGLKVGGKITIYPAHDGSFIGIPKRKSKIMEFAGFLKHLDDGRPLNEIREEAQKLAAEDIAKRANSG